MSSLLAGTVCLYTIGGIALAFVSPRLWRDFAPFHLLPIFYGIIGSVIFHWFGLIRNLTVPNPFVLAVSFYALAWVSVLERSRWPK